MYFNLKINIICEYQRQICCKFLLDFIFNANKLMFLCIISPQSPAKLVVKITKDLTREQNFRTNSLVVRVRYSPAPRCLRPFTEGSLSRVGMWGMQNVIRLSYFCQDAIIWIVKRLISGTYFSIIYHAFSRQIVLEI